VDDAAPVEEPLPDPDGKLRDEGQPVIPTGTSHQINSLVLNAPESPVHTSPTQRHDGDPVLTDQRKAEAQAGSSVIVDFNQRQEIARRPSMPQQTHASGVYASVTAAELRDWLHLR
jgi:hypothetical protein